MASLTCPGLSRPRYKADLLPKYDFFPIKADKKRNIHLQDIQAVKIFHDWAHLPISQDEYAAKIAIKQQKLFPEAAPLPGVVKLLHDLHATTNTSQPVYIALATSSHKRNYELKTGHLPELFSLFPKARQVLGDDPRIGKGRGKPLPDIYLLALETINQELREKGEEPIKPEECLVFEDAVPGVEAGRRAGMQAIWCPHPLVLDVYKGREEEVLAGLTGEHKEEEKTDAEKEADALQGGRLAQANGSGKPGKLNDGFACLLSTLEDFPYEKYGIVIPS
jgi:pseudouridine-5'-monophosphatase